MHDDLRELREFLSEYQIKLQQDMNRIVKVRSLPPFEDHYTIKNPKLKMTDDWMVIPDVDIPCDRREDYYITLSESDDQVVGLHIQKSGYLQENYNDTGCDLRFDVVNRIVHFIETKVREAGSDKLDVHLKRRDVHRDTNCFICGERFDAFWVNPKERSQEPQRWYYSDVPWEKRIQKYRSFVFPDCILFMVPNLFYDTEPSSTPDNRDLIAFRELQVEYYDCQIFWYWRQCGADDIVRDYVDTELLEFLNRREIPTLRAIMRHKELRPITAQEIGFLNDTAFPLFSLWRERPNAVTTFAFTFFMSFLERLREDKVLSSCDYCGHFFRYRKNKKFCSLLTEKRDCGKKARNKRDYTKHREKRLIYSREQMRLYRELTKRYVSK